MRSYPEGVCFCPERAYRTFLKRELLSLYPKNSEDRIEKFLGSSFDVLICANFGPKAMARLKEGGISLYTFGGGCEMAVRKYMEGDLTEL